MNFTLHLTENCNLGCVYCPNPKSAKRMSDDVLYAACELAFSRGKGAGFCFFGGEPLLAKDLIYKAIDRCTELSAKTGKKANYKMTTNGTLLDEAFLERSCSVGMMIGLSFDGLMQDKSRCFKDGSGSRETVEKNARLLLSRIPNAYAMMTVAPFAVSSYFDSVRYLYSLGFRRIIATIAYGNKVSWTDSDIDLLRSELDRIAEFYTDILLNGVRFYFSPFDSKITECIKDKNTADHCHLGFRQMPIDTDGSIYPCTQFVGDKDWYIGNVFDGIDVNRQIVISKRASMPEECRECELNRRCTNSCGCTNRLETGDENKVSPLTCTYERMIIEISDRIAGDLFKNHYDIFIQRFGR
ncbi:MAG: radical SAM protein [Ruminiclostridium sp.]|nr:radical SAM protein [Ruminiclostridium sp.]